MLEQLTEILVDQLGVNAEDVTAESKFVEDLGADSLDVFQSVMGIEEKFEIEIAEEEAADIKTVGEALALIEAKKN